MAPLDGQPPDDQHLNNQHLTNQIIQNLNHQQLWTDLKSINLPLNESENAVFISGIPFDKLHPDDNEKRLEWVFPVSTEGQISIKRLSEIFNALKLHNKVVISRILMAMITNDSTIVYYLIHEGLQKPRKN